MDRFAERLDLGNWEFEEIKLYCEICKDEIETGQQYLDGDWGRIVCLKCLKEMGIAEVLDYMEFDSMEVLNGLGLIKEKSLF